MSNEKAPVWLELSRVEERILWVALDPAWTLHRVADPVPFTGYGTAGGGPTGVGRWGGRRTGGVVAGVESEMGLGAGAVSAAMGVSSWIETTPGLGWDVKGQNS